MKISVIVALSLLSLAALADEKSKDPQQKDGVKSLSGMSILGNNEAPKSLVIVPWKSSELGDGIDVGNLLDDRANPVDKEVFMRELSFYQIRAGGHKTFEATDK